MFFELGLEEPDPGRALRSALTIALAYIAGGLVPLSPYLFVSRVDSAFLFSVATTLIALFVFDFVKARYTGAPPAKPTNKEDEHSRKYSRSRFGRKLPCLASGSSLSGPNFLWSSEEHCLDA